MQELTNDKVLAEADLNRLLGTLRYLQGLKSAREQVEALPAEPDQATEPRAADATASGYCSSLPSCISIILIMYSSHCTSSCARVASLQHVKCRQSSICSIQRVAVLLLV